MKSSSHRPTPSSGSLCCTLKKIGEPLDKDVVTVLARVHGCLGRSGCMPWRVIEVPYSTPGLLLQSPAII